jgi:hypothetical protein
MTVPVIVDCDPGHDDVFALWLAAGHPSLELLAVTTVGGNVPLEHTSRNARIALSVAGVSGVPVAAGAAGPLARTLATAEWIHGENGLGGPVLPEPAAPLDPRGATELMADTLLTADEPMAIVATGPITNVAVLLRDRPDVTHRIREIVWMGGSTGRGNVTPYAEFNAWVDPEALALVAGSGIRFTMVGLNVTHQALVTAAVRDRLAAVGNATADRCTTPSPWRCSPTPAACSSCTRASTSSSPAARRWGRRASTSTGCCAASRTPGWRPASTSTASGASWRPRSHVSPDPASSRDRGARGCAWIGRSGSVPVCS